MNETIEDIVAEMREDFSTPWEYVYPKWARGLADRIEAAAKRGNAAKIREAYEFAEEFLRDYGTDWKLHNKLCDMLKSAMQEAAK